jgi:glyoxylase-like metal-dependent hydrolase (beta-lactamase superfamily II)
MSARQEQEQARPEVIEVAEKVLRMQLPIEMFGLGHVNMYGFCDDDGIAVVDPGLPGDTHWEVIKQRLASAGYEIRHVHTVVITHSHPDHFGGAARFHMEAGSRIIAHESFSAFGHRLGAEHLEVSVEHLDASRAPRVAAGSPVALRQDAATEGGRSLLTRPSQRSRTPWGGEPMAQNPEDHERWERLFERGLAVPRLTHVVTHGSTIRLAGRDWSVWHTPGHTADHVCLHDREQGVFLSGDHVLPSITPHISGMSDEPDPLRAFYASLDTVSQIDGVGRCLPAHGHPFPNLAERTAAIKRHHHERLDKLKAIARRIGPATVRQFSEELFQPRSWGTMAESETYAHLEHLRLARMADAHRRADGLMVYVA